MSLEVSSDPVAVLTLESEVEPEPGMESDLLGVFWKELLILLFELRALHAAVNCSAHAQCSNESPLHMRM